MTTILNGQNMLDLSIQEYGNIETAIRLANANGLSVTSDLEVGNELGLPELENNDSIVAQFAVREEKPSTLVTLEEVEMIGENNNDPCDLCKCFL